jgi:membrane protein implicated in regulation of membrane protease activity
VISWFGSDHENGTALPMAMPKFVILMLALALMVGVVLFISSGSVLLAICAAAATAVVMQVVYFALIVRYVAAKKRETNADMPPVLKQEPAKNYELSPKSPNQ